MQSTSLEATEAYSAARATAPRVSLDDIKDRIVGEFYVRGHEAAGFIGLYDEGTLAHTCSNALRLLTLCILVLDNGFTVVGKSAPASAENFDREKGETFAYEDAIRQVWPLMGFALKEHQHFGGQSAWAQPAKDQG